MLDKYKSMNVTHADAYLFGGNREKAIIRDGEKCAGCGMTREQHKKTFGRDLTVDHINGKGRYTPKEEKDNRLENLKTLCLICHGSKDCIRMWKSKPKTYITCIKCNTARDVIRRKTPKPNRKFWCEECQRMVRPLLNLKEAE